MKFARLQDIIFFTHKLLVWYVKLQSLDYMICFMIFTFKWFTPAFWLAWYVHILAIAQKQQSVECKLLIPHHPHSSCLSNEIDWICGVTKDNNIIQIQSLISTLYRNSLTCEFLTSSQNSEKPIMGEEEIWDTLRFWLLYTNPEHE
jgi:hypothetical protein